MSEFGFKSCVFLALCWGLMTLGQVKRVPDFWYFGPQRAEKQRPFGRNKTANLSYISGLWTWIWPKVDLPFSVTLLVLRWVRLQTLCVQLGVWYLLPLRNLWFFLWLRHLRHRRWGLLAGTVKWRRMSFPEREHSQIGKPAARIILNYQE